MNEQSTPAVQRNDPLPSNNHKDWKEDQLKGQSSAAKYSKGVM